MRRNPIKREVIGLTGVQARLPGVAADRPEPVNRIAARLRCKPSNITGLVDRQAEIETGAPATTAG